MTPRDLATIDQLRAHYEDALHEEGVLPQSRDALMGAVVALDMVRKRADALRRHGHCTEATARAAAHLAEEMWMVLEDGGSFGRPTDVPWFRNPICPPTST
jgi:hypothetical protein